MRQTQDPGLNGSDATCSRRRTLLALAGATSSLFVPGVWAQAAYPTQAIKILVGAGAGGSTDFTARAVGQELAKLLGQPVVVENRAGAAGMLSMQQASRAAPDGYTLVWAGNSALAILPYLHLNPGYDIKAMSMVSLGCTSSFVLVADPSLGIQSIQDLVAYGKANKDKLSFGSNGVNGSAHLLGELLKSEAGFEALHVPYKGGSEWTAALLAGNIQFLFDGPSSYIPLIRAGKVKALAVTGPKREKALPEVPTMAELGLPRMTTEIFFGLIAPPGTPVSIVSRLADAMKSALLEPGLLEALSKAGYEGQSSSPAQLRSRVDAEGMRFRALLESRGVVPQ